VLLACRKWSTGATGKEAVIAFEETVAGAAASSSGRASAHAIFDLPAPEPVAGDLDREMAAAALGLSRRRSGSRITSPAATARDALQLVPVRSAAIARAAQTARIGPRPSDRAAIRTHTWLPRD
jgi:hypothetical protein